MGNLTRLRNDNFLPLSSVIPVINGISQARTHGPGGGARDVFAADARGHLKGRGHEVKVFHGFSSQDGPLPVVNGVITPINGLING